MKEQFLANEKVAGSKTEPFCKNTTRAVNSGKTLLDNIFVSEYMKYLPGDAVKAYLLGQYMCQDGAIFKNTRDDFEKAAGLTGEQLDVAFSMLSDEGLVELVWDGDCYEVRFPPVREVVSNIKKYNATKYTDFNAQIQNVLEGQALTPNEFTKFYDVMEVYKIEQAALLLVAKHCALLKGDNIGAAYIVAVAKKFAHEGARTAKDVEAKLLELERSTGKIKELLAAMKITRSAKMEEREMFLFWKKQLKFSDDLILAAQRAGNKIDTFTKLDKLLTHYNAMELKSEKEIEAYENTRKVQFETAQEIVKKLGLFYQNIEPVVETYVSVWFAKGYERALLVGLAKSCFEQGIRTLEGFNSKLTALYSKGVLSLDAFKEYSQEVAERDGKVKKVLDAAGIAREITNFDRSNVNTWMASWGFSLDVILHAAGIAAGSGLSPMAQIGRILTEYKAAGAMNLEAAKNVKLQGMTSGGAKKVAKNYDEHTFDSEKLKSVFANLDDLLKD